MSNEMQDRSRSEAIRPNSTELVSKNTTFSTSESESVSVLLSPSETVRFWAGRIVAKIQSEGLPAELGLIGKLAGPFLNKALTKIEALSDDQAREIIDSVHALSAKIEEQTGEDSKYH